MLDIGAMCICFLNRQQPDNLLVFVQSPQTELAQEPRLGKVYKCCHFGVESSSGTWVRFSAVGQRGAEQTVVDRLVEASHHLHRASVAARRRQVSRMSVFLASQPRTRQSRTKRRVVEPVNYLRVSRDRTICARLRDPVFFMNFRVG
jgi:hypothetical protein